MNRFWLPCLISVAVHAAVLIPLIFVPTPACLLPGRPLTLETVVLEDELTLAPSEAIWPITLMAASPPPASAPSAPIVIPEPSAEAAPPEPVRPVGYHEGAAGTALPASGADHGDGSGGSGRSAAGTSFFAVPTRARNIVYVIDRSISMGLSGALSAVKRELIASVNQLPSDARFQIVLYNRKAEPLIVGGSTGAIPATAANKQIVARQIEVLDAEGGTDHLPAFALALSLEPDVIYFLTDADDLRPEQVRQMTQMNHSRAVVNALSVTTGKVGREDTPLQALARENHGTYTALVLSH